MGKVAGERHATRWPCASCNRRCPVSIVMRPTSEARRQHPIVRKATSVRYDELPDVLTPKEAQAFLRLGRNATYAALQDGRIRSVRLGQKFLIPKAALREFLDRDAEHPRAGIPVKGTT